jgi:hypothetical protein
MYKGDLERRPVLIKEELTSMEVKRTSKRNYLPTLVSAGGLKQMETVKDLQKKLPTNAGLGWRSKGIMS